MLISNVFLIADQMFVKCSFSVRAKMQMKTKIMKMRPYNTMNFAKSLSIAKKMLIKGPKNQLPLKNSKNQSQFTVTQIV